MEIRHTHKEIPCVERKFRLADFIWLNWDKYAEHPTEPIRPEQYKAVNAIRVCRTAALGVDTYVCPECGEVSEIYHSCKNRFCPTCSWRDTMLWAERVKKQMLNIPHRHVVMTLPHLLNPLIKRNGKELLNVLMKTSAETMKDWIENKYSLKAGVISVLHTFGEKKNYHVHVHMIVTWGGIHKSTGELVEIQSPYVRVSFLQKKFREKFRERLNFMYKYGILKHDFRNDDEFADFKRSMYQSCWTINLEPPMKIPSQVICYIGRYSKRACLSEYKITAIEGEYISFRYKDYRSSPDKHNPEEKILTLHYSEFFPRLLQHVPLPYFRIVRYYGVYSHKSTVPEEYLYQEDTEEPCTDTVENESEYENPYYCKPCQRYKIYHCTTLVRHGTNNKEPECLVFQRPELVKRKVA